MTERVERAEDVPRVRIVDYDPAWVGEYAYEADRVTAALDGWLVAIEHVGSTSVPGLAAKPIIDLLASVTDYHDFATMISRLVDIGYRYTPHSEADDPDRRVFRKGPDDLNRPRSHHLHVTEVGSHYWDRIIAFRDHLRREPAAAAAYEAVKRPLAEQFANEPRRYTEAKHAFVKATERMAFASLAPRRTSTLAVNWGEAWMRWAG